MEVKRDMAKKFLFTRHDFNYLGFEVSIYPSSQEGILSISIYDPLQGGKIHSYKSEQITAMVMDFAMNKVHEVIASDEL
jgi:hypothetical protein